jgi:hypothetical protein
VTESDETIRSIEEIYEALDEMIERQWFERSRLSAPDPRAGHDPGSDGRLELEEKYGLENLGPYSDFEWATIQGKRAALQWVLGGEWDDPQDT